MVCYKIEQIQSHPPASLARCIPKMPGPPPQAAHESGVRPQESAVVTSRSLRSSNKAPLALSLLRITNWNTTRKPIRCIRVHIILSTSSPTTALCHSPLWSPLAAEQSSSRPSLASLMSRRMLSFPSSIPTTPIG